MTTNIATEREAFEAWFHKEYGYHYSQLNGDRLVRANAILTGWLARAAITSQLEIN